MTKPVPSSMDAAIREYVYRKHPEETVESITIEGDDDRNASVTVVLKPTFQERLTITLSVGPPEEHTKKPS